MPNAARIRELLVSLPIYRPTRFLYQQLFDRDAIVRRRDRRVFYSSFVHPGDLVFDVGANLGNYSEALLAIGANVVAIEPDPRNQGILRKRFGSSVVLEACALGRTEGFADLHLADRDDMSTLSAEWAASMKAQWQGSVRVVVKTLDLIAQSYGVPTYVKIDAEGYDAEILASMSFCPEMVSFEFVPGSLTVTQSCIELLEKFQFNYVIEERSRFELDRWVDHSEIETGLAALPIEIMYGDVFARKCT
jgi:FkbM family methyltransferase